MEFIIITLLLIIIAELTFVATRLHQPSARRDGRRKMFVDTSVLIDGRIVAVAQSGFISDSLVIPRSVIGELQFLADNADSEKRTRARHGLDVIAELQAIEGLSVEIFPDSSRTEEGVDQRLLKLAKEHDGLLCTIDYNLNKVAQVEGIEVVNVNDLAKSLRMAYLPGEKIKIALTTKGNDSSQAVGHLEDGTMVVVEQAKSKIGSIVEAEVVRSLQTAAGRMMFARLVVEKATTAPKDTRSDTTAKASSVKKTIKRDKLSKKLASTSAGRRKPVSQQTDKRAPRKDRVSSSRNNEDRLIELVNKQ